MFSTTMPAACPLPRWPTLNLERRFEGVVCGIDEAGCAPLAGPVVAAAVILPRGPKPRVLRGLTDSKLLSGVQRERFFDIIHRVGHVGVGLATVEEIDRWNILQADLLAMRRAVEDLGATPDAALVDGRHSPAIECLVKPIVRGDRRSLSVAAASVIAKVVRDRGMRELAKRYPHYGWHTNVGYGTDEHYLGLLRTGPTKHHRRSFAPLTTIFAPGSTAFEGLVFRPVSGGADLKRVHPLELRHDLYAVFEGNGHHVGVMKNLRGHWTFLAVGYAENATPILGGGPCAPCHRSLLDEPIPACLRRLFARIR
jgi:ribonuclease HII